MRPGRGSGPGSMPCVQPHLHARESSSVPILVTQPTPRQILMPSLSPARSSPKMGLMIILMSATEPSADSRTSPAARSLRLLKGLITVDGVSLTYQESESSAIAAPHGQCTSRSLPWPPPERSRSASPRRPRPRTARCASSRSPTLAYNQQTAAWTEPFVVPENCIQRLVSDETVRDIYPASTASRP